MDLRKIKKLIEMLQESDLNEIEVKEGEESVRINRKKSDAEIPQQIVAPQLQSKEIVENVDEPEENLSYIQSPMVGTFYRSPAPGKTPFVEIGKNVKKGYTVCRI